MTCTKVGTKRSFEVRSMVGSTIFDSELDLIQPKRRRSNSYDLPTDDDLSDENEQRHVRESIEFCKEESR